MNYLWLFIGLCINFVLYVNKFVSIQLDQNLLEEYLIAVQKIINECRKAFPISDGKNTNLYVSKELETIIIIQSLMEYWNSIEILEDMQLLIERKIPKTQEGKWFESCVFKKFGIVSFFYLQIIRL